MIIILSGLSYLMSLNSEPQFFFLLISLNSVYNLQETVIKIE